ncbi:hypothetical protein AB0B01_25175 [Streptomyces sp. NPDC044571]|uniref:hypothetical protein n=1 Tax=Streptomyces sp. NPDC044571 TaxID=3155371 RepID=UPI0033D33D83
MAGIACQTGVTRFIDTCNPGDATALSLAPLFGSDLLPAEPVVPSLVQPADPSFLISTERAAILKGRGFEVRSVAAAGHTIHRDDFDGFTSSPQGWI